MIKELKLSGNPVLLLSNYMMGMSDSWRNSLFIVHESYVVTKIVKAIICIFILELIINLSRAEVSFNNK